MTHHLDPQTWAEAIADKAMAIATQAKDLGNQGVSDEVTDDLRRIYLDLDGVLCFVEHEAVTASHEVPSGLLRGDDDDDRLMGVR